MSHSLDQRARSVHLESYGIGAANAVVTAIPNLLAFTANYTPVGFAARMLGWSGVPYMEGPFQDPNACNDIYNWSGGIGATIGPQILIGGGVAGVGQTAARLTAAQELSAAMRSLLASRSGFSGHGARVIVDENLPASWVGPLREAGFDATSVQMMGLAGNRTPDELLRQIAEQTGARVLTRDRGRDLAGGFGSLGVQLDRRITEVSFAIRLLNGG